MSLSLIFFDSPNDRDGERRVGIDASIKTLHELLLSGSGKSFFTILCQTFLSELTRFFKMCVTKVFILVKKCACMLQREKHKGREKEGEFVQTMNKNQDSSRTAAVVGGRRDMKPIP